MEKFFIVCPLGLEQVCAQEIARKWPLFHPSTPYKVLPVIGGLELETEMAAGLSLNLILRTPSRILLRLKVQKCRDLPKLFGILSKLPWKDLLTQKNIKIKATCKSSRLIHTGRIEETALEAIDKYFTGQALSGHHQKQEKPDQLVLLRIEKDELTVSLDTSGKHLHIRGGNSYRAHAPLRESLAATCLEFMTKGNNALTLLDPMCGSATFIKEYLGLNQLNSGRDFAFENWKSVPKQPNFEPGPSSGIARGADINLEIVKKLQNEGLKVTNQDFFEDPLPKCDYLIINPPYGKRIPLDGKPTTYFKRLVARAQESSAKSIGIIIPLPFSKSFNTKKRLSFSQNGINVEFLVF